MTVRQSYEAIARDPDMTETRMPFDEWWEEYWSPPAEHSVCDAALKDVAQKVWDAATSTERERCARMAEGIERPDEQHWIREDVFNELCRRTAAEIRREP